MKIERGDFLVYQYFEYFQKTVKKKLEGLCGKKCGGDK